MKNIPLFWVERSFTQKIQIKQYEPIDSTCTAGQAFESIPTQEEMEAVAAQLDEFCVREVRRSLKERASALSREISSEEGPY